MPRTPVKGKARPAPDPSTRGRAASAGAMPIGEVSAEVAGGRGRRGTFRFVDTGGAGPHFA